MKKMLRRALAAALIAVLAVSLAAAGFAEAAGLESYVAQPRENGDIRVCFGEVEVTLPAAWADKIDIFPHDTYALFCHRESCRLWAENTGYTESGVLFSLNVSETTDYTKLPSYMDIGAGEHGNYYLAFPTDYQAYAEDEAARAEFDALLDGMDFVKENARMVEDPAEALEAAAPELVPMPGTEAEAEPEPILEPMPEEVSAEPDLVPMPEEAAAEPEVAAEPVLVPMPGAEAEAEAEPILEPMPEEVTAEPDLVPMPEEAAAEPEVAAEPDLVPMPEAAAEPEVAAEPDLVPMPEAAAEPEVAAEPALEPMPETAAAEPALEPMPEADVAEPEAVEAAEPEVAPEIAAEPEAAPEIEADPEAEPAPEAAGDGVRSIVYDASTAPFDGVWVTFDDGFQLLLPGEWLSYEITEEQSAAGLFFRAGNDGSDSVVGEIPMGVAVSYVEAGDLVTLDDLVQDFESAGFTNLEKLDLNGVPSVFFVKPDEDYCGVAFYHAVYPEYVMAIYATPIGSAGDAVAAVDDAILSSLKPYTPQE